MSADSHGRCPHCNVIFIWKTRRNGPRVTMGEAFCPVDGRELQRTAARVAKNITQKRQDPVGLSDAARLRAKVP